MKKLIFILMMLPVMVLGEETTCEKTNDIIKTDSQSKLVCDIEKRTATTFKTEKEVIAVKNDVCTIKCTEEVVFLVDPIKKVLAGMSFNYPLYVSGERKCKAEYHYDTYETKIRKLVDEYATLTNEVEKATKANEITNYYAQKQACDEFGKEGSEYQKKYSYGGEVKLTVETSTSSPTISYTFKEITDYDSVIIKDEVRYEACNYDEVGRKCLESYKTLRGWTETTRIFGKYTMEDAYLEKYTGEVKSSSGNTCNAGDRYFVSLTEVTRPSKDDKTDKGYKLTLTTKGIGDKLIETRDLNVDCWYQVSNLIFPQNNSTKKDDNYEKYGGTAFEYRIIDLNEPFPGREPGGRKPGANWVGKEDIIFSTKDNLSSLQKFVITLNRSSINRIREYNDVHSYDTFDLNEEEKSLFIINNPSIIER